MAKLSKIENITKRVVQVVEQRMKSKDWKNDRDSSGDVKMKIKNESLTSFGAETNSGMNQDEKKFYDYTENLLQVYSQVQEGFKDHMKNLGLASIADLPEPDLEILETTQDKIKFTPSLLILK